MLSMLDLVKRDLWGFGAESWLVVATSYAFFGPSYFVTALQPTMTAPRPQRSSFANPNLCTGFTEVVNNFGKSDDDMAMYMVHTYTEKMMISYSCIRGFMPDSHKKS